MNSRKRRRLIAEIIERDGDLCFYCGCEMTSLDHTKTNFLTLEHVIAKSEGGPDYIDNLVVACRQCNANRGPSHFRPFCESLGMPGDKISSAIARANANGKTSEMMIAPSDGIRVIYDVDGAQFDDLAEAEVHLRKMKEKSLKAELSALLPPSMDGRTKVAVVRRLTADTSKVMEILSALKSL